MKEKTMLIDSSNCIGCKACVVACKQENGFSVGNNLLKIHQKEHLNDHLIKYYEHHSCLHCDEPECVAACPVGAITKNADGIVQYNEYKCIGCHACVTVCPHIGVRIMTNGLVGKCNLCKDRLESDLAPACVIVCPTKARMYDSKEVILQIAAKRQKENQGYEAQLKGTKIITVLPK